MRNLLVAIRVLLLLRTLVAGWPVTLFSKSFIMPSYRRKRYSSRRRRFPTRRRRFSSRRKRYPSRRRRFSSRRRRFSSRRKRYLSRRRRFPSRGRRLLRSSGNDAFGSAKTSTNLVLKTAVTTLEATDLAENKVLNLSIKNPMSVFNLLPDDVAGVTSVAVPRSFPQGSNGSFWVFNLVAAQKAFIASWSAHHQGFHPVRLGPWDLGSTKLRHPDELRQRYYALKNTRTCTPRIRLTFTRRAGRIGPFYQTTPEKTDIRVAAQVGTIAMASGTAGTVTYPSYVQKSEVTDNSFNYIPTGELPWYSQYTKGSQTGHHLFDRFKNGFPWPASSGTAVTADPITGTDNKAIFERQTRMLNEMVSTRQWQSHAPSCSYSFDLYSRSGANDKITCATNAAGALVYGVGTVAEEDNTNYTQTNVQMCNSRLVFANGEVDDWITIPFCSAPNGTCVIWSPYPADMVRANYDVSVTVYNKFKGKGASVLDWASKTDIDVN